MPRGRLAIVTSHEAVILRIVIAVLRHRYGSPERELIVAAGCVEYRNIILCYRHPYSGNSAILPLT